MTWKRFLWFLAALWVYVRALWEFVILFAVMALVFFCIPVGMLFPLHLSLWLHGQRDAAKVRLDAIMARAQELERQGRYLR